MRPEPRRYAAGSYNLKPCLDDAHFRIRSSRHPRVQEGKQTILNLILFQVQSKSVSDQVGVYDFQRCKNAFAPAMSLHLFFTTFFLLIKSLDSTDHFTGMRRKTRERKKKACAHGEYQASLPLEMPTQCLLLQTHRSLETKSLPGKPSKIVGITHRLPSLT